MKKTLSILSFIVACTVWPMAVSSGVIEPSASYKQCTGLVQHKPQRALETAEAWFRRDHSPAALHCRALAKYGLRQYVAAAKDLEALAADVGMGQSLLWSGIIRQAATAYIQVKEYQKADVLLTQAITHSTNARLDAMLSTLLLDRANLYLDTDRPLLAIQDMDQVLIMNAANKNALLIRARALIDVKATEEARADVKRVLALDNTNKDARALSKKLGKEKPVKKKIIEKKAAGKKAVKTKKSSKKATMKASAKKSKKKKPVVKPTKKKARKK